MGINVGYPVRRHEGRSRAAPRPLEPGASVAVRWSGRIGSEIVSLDASIPARVTRRGRARPLRRDDRLGATPRTSCAPGARRPPTRVRLCRIGGCEPGLEIHAPTADLLLIFDDGAIRDRLAATLR